MDFMGPDFPGHSSATQRLGPVAFTAEGQYACDDDEQADPASEIWPNSRPVVPDISERVSVPY